MWSVVLGFLKKLGKRVVSRIERAPNPPVRQPEKSFSSKQAPVEPSKPEEVNDVAQCSISSLSNLKSEVTGAGKPRLVIHWATWCDGCIEEVGDLIRLHGNYGDRVDFVGVCWDSFQSGASSQDVLINVDKFIKANHIGWPSLLVMSEPDELFETLNMECHTVPQIWMVDPLGNVTYQENGPLTKEAYNDLSDAIDLVLVS
jgi:thiol-disulfide isomerase/thioredoxin